MKISFCLIKKITYLKTNKKKRIINAARCCVEMIYQHCIEQLMKFNFKKS